jgi:hypothetical protein
MQLQKAKITQIGENGEVGKWFYVQFNPTTLRLTLDNRVAGGKTQQNVVRQITGHSSTTLALDLVFDSADEGSTALPVSVREKTKQLEVFLVPRDGQATPPKIRFEWGDMIIDGTVDNLTVDFDHFAADGAPLRAKVSLSIQGQDRSKELKEIEPDERKDAAKPGGSSGGGVGDSGGRGVARSPNTATALAGESAGDLAARLGIDPAAWRGLQLGGESSLSLSAGAEIGFSVNLNASVGLGVTLGVEAGASVSLEASFGLEASASLNAVAGVGAGADLASGFALSSAGGVTAAIESVQSARSQAAEQQARAAFNAPAKALPAASGPTKQSAGSTVTSASTASVQPKQPEQKHVPLQGRALPSVSAQQAAQPAPRIPRADPRGSSFGFGVPLRATFGEAADRRAESIRGDVAIKRKIANGDPPSTSDPTMPGWVALPKRDRGRNAADKLQSNFRPKRPCGCAGGCRH